MYSLAAANVLNVSLTDNEMKLSKPLNQMKGEILMKMTSKVLVFLMALVMVFTALTGCNSATQPSADANTPDNSASQEPDTAKPKELEFMFCSPKTDDPIWLVAKEGFEAAAEDFGFNGTWTGCIDHTVDGTVQALESTIASQPDGIVAVPLSPPAFTNTLQKAKDQDIPVICLILKPESKDLRTGWIGADFTKAGTQAITEIHKTLGTDEIKLGAVVSNLDVAIQIEQYKAAEAYMKDYPGSELVEIIEDKADPNEAYRLIKDLLTAHPEINAIQSTESGGTPGVGKALAELGLTEKVVAVCSDDTDINLDTIRAGSIHGTTAQDFWGMGYLAGKYLYMKAMGMEIPDETDTGVILVTKDNIDTYAADRDAEHQKWREEAPEIVAKANK